MMGATYIGMTAQAKTEEELRQRYEKVVAQLQHKVGRGYTGTFAEKPRIEFVPGTWAKSKAARHCERENEKWGPTFAYNLGDGRWYIGGWCSE